MPGVRDADQAARARTTVDVFLSAVSALAERALGAGRWALARAGHAARSHTWSNVSSCIVKDLSPHRSDCGSEADAFFWPEPSAPQPEPPLTYRRVVAPTRAAKPYPPRDGRIARHRRPGSRSRVPEWTRSEERRVGQEARGGWRTCDRC